MSSSGYSRRNRRGLTLTDLCVVLAILVLLLAVAPIIRSNAFEEQNKAKCATNLSRIYGAMATYANVNNGNYPRTYFAREKNTAVGDLTDYTGVNSHDSLGPDGPGPNDTTGSIFLLFKITPYPPDIMVCPSSDAVVYDPVVCGNILERSNFSSRQNLSYSMQNPFPSQQAVRMGWQWHVSFLGPNSPLFSDMNPGTPELATLTYTAPTSQLRASNSPNHDGRGQNVLYGDNTVLWQTSPFCGAPRAYPIPANDNIFTSNTSPPTVGGWPQDSLDAVMLPLDTTGLQPPAKSKSWSQWTVIAGVGGVLVLGVIVLLIVLLKRKKPAMAPGYEAGGGYPPTGPPPPLPPQQY